MTMKAVRATGVIAVVFALLGATGVAFAADPPNWVAILYIEAQKAVGLRWTPAAGATGYKVLRSTVQGKDYKEIASTPAPQHFDKDVEPGSTYYYVLQSLAGAEVSANSAEKSVSIPGQKKVDVVAVPELEEPTLTESTEFGKTIFKVGVFWKKSANPAVVAYNLYRTTTPGKDYQLLTSTAENRYVDVAVEDGKTYYYAVSAIDSQFVETPLSNEQSLAVVKTVREARKAAEKKKSMPIVPVKTKDLYRLPVKNYPVDLQLLPDGELAVAAGYLLLFTSPGNPEEPAKDISEGWMDFNGVELDNDGNLIAVSASKGIRIYNTRGQVKSEFPIPSPEKGSVIDYGEEKQVAKQAIFVDAAQAPDGTYYVTDNNNHRVVMIDEKGKYLGPMNEGTPEGKLENPTHIKIEKEKGRKYINSFGRSAVMMFDKDDKLIRIVGELGAQVGTFGKVQGLSFDKAGVLYVADMQNGNIQTFSAEGEVMGLLTDDTGKKNIHVTLISGIAVTPDGKRVYAAESMNKTIAVLDIIK